MGNNLLKNTPVAGGWTVSVVTHRAVALADFPEDSYYIPGIHPQTANSAFSLLLTLWQHTVLSVPVASSPTNSELSSAATGPSSGCEAVCLPRTQCLSFGFSWTQFSCGQTGCSFLTLSGYAVLLIHGYRHLLSTVYLNMDSDSEGRQY